MAKNQVPTSLHKESGSQSNQVLSTLPVGDLDNLLKRIVGQQITQYLGANNERIKTSRVSVNDFVQLKSLRAVIGDGFVLIHEDLTKLTTAQSSGGGNTSTLMTPIGPVSFDTDNAINQIANIAKVGAICSTILGSMMLLAPAITLLASSFTIKAVGQATKDFLEGFGNGAKAIAEGASTIVDSLGTAGSKLIEASGNRALKRAEAFVTEQQAITQAKDADAQRRKLEIQIDFFEKTLAFSNPKNYAEDPTFKDTLNKTLISFLGDNMNLFQGTDITKLDTQAQVILAKSRASVIEKQSSLIEDLLHKVLEKINISEEEVKEVVTEPILTASTDYISAFFSYLSPNDTKQNRLAKIKSNWDSTENIFSNIRKALGTALTGETDLESQMVSEISRVLKLLPPIMKSISNEELEKNIDKELVKEALVNGSVSCIESVIAQASTSINEAIEKKVSEEKTAAIRGTNKTYTIQSSVKDDFANSIISIDYTEVATTLFSRAKLNLLNEINKDDSSTFTESIDKIKTTIQGSLVTVVDSFFDSLTSNVQKLTKKELNTYNGGDTEVSTPFDTIVGNLGVIVANIFKNNNVSDISVNITSSLSNGISSLINGYSSAILSNYEKTAYYTDYSNVLDALNGKYLDAIETITPSSSSESIMKIQTGVSSFIDAFPTGILKVFDTYVGTYTSSIISEIKGKYSTAISLINPKTGVNASTLNSSVENGLKYLITKYSESASNHFSNNIKSSNYSDLITYISTKYVNVLSQVDTSNITDLSTTENKLKEGLPSIIGAYTSSLSSSLTTEDASYLLLSYEDVIPTLNSKVMEALGKVTSSNCIDTSVVEGQIKGMISSVIGSLSNNITSVDITKKESIDSDTFSDFYSELDIALYKITGRISTIIDNVLNDKSVNNFEFDLNDVFDYNSVTSSLMGIINSYMTLYEGAMNTISLTEIKSDTSTFGFTNYFNGVRNKLSSIVYDVFDSDKLSSKNIKEKVPYSTLYAKIGSASTNVIQSYFNRIGDFVSNFTENDFTLPNENVIGSVKTSLGTIATKISESWKDAVINADTTIDLKSQLDYTMESSQFNTMNTTLSEIKEQVDILKGFVETISKKDANTFINPTTVVGGSSSSKTISAVPSGM